MSLTHSGIFGPEDVDLARLQAEGVRYGVLVDLPFRIRVRDLFHVQPVDSATDVWLYNAVSIPPGSDLTEILQELSKRDRDGYDALWTKAIVVLNSPALVDGALDGLRNGQTRALGLGGNLFRALTVLNEVIFGYAEAAGTLFGGTPLRFLTDTEFFAGLKLEFALVSDTPGAVTEADVKEVIEWRPERAFRSLGQLTGDLFDLPEEGLSSIPKYIESFRAEAYQELAFRAKMAMVDRQPVVALVLACAALEGAHADLLRRSVRRPLSVYGKNADGIVENLLREQGIYTLIQLTSQLFVDSSARPTPEDVQLCCDALTMRNDIVHAKQKKGTYRLRVHTFKNLSDAYSAVLRMYSSFLAALRSDVFDATSGREPSTG